MTIKLSLSVIFALLSGSSFYSPLFTILVTKLASENQAVTKNTANIISQSPIGEAETPIFQPRARNEDAKYRGRMVGVSTFARGGCPDTEPPPLTALVTGEDGEITVRTTTAKPDPIFWFYFPYPSDSNLSAEFELQDENGNTLLPFAKKPLQKTGIFRIQLPSVLEPDRNYYWSLKIICDPNRRDLDDYIDGYVTRVKVTSSPIGTTPEQRAAYYAKNGLWHETLTTYIEDVCPQNAQAAKSRISSELSSPNVGLEKYTVRYTRAIIEYCNPNSISG